MSKYLPILKNTNDPHYRYNMPKMITKIEGNGNGIKTIIVNMTGIARSLGRSPICKFVFIIFCSNIYIYIRCLLKDTLKYIGYELGAQVRISNENYIVNGLHDEAKLTNLIYCFINKVVQCQMCKNPETTMVSILCYTLYFYDNDNIFFS